MEAVRWHARRDVRLEPAEFAEPLGRGMVEAEVAFCGICGSDVTEFANGPFAIRPKPHALSGQAPPLTLGHEFSGRVVETAPDVTGIAVGDRVAADACWRCQACEPCRRGDYNHCALGGSIGLCSDGGFALRVRFPAYCAVPLPEEVSYRQGALLEPLAVGLHALERANARAGETVVVLGFGPIGAAVAEIGRAEGLRCIVSEPNPDRRARAEALGHPVFVPDGEPRAVAKAIRGLTGGGADVVVDASGAPVALAAAPDMTVRGGRIVLVGLPKEPLPVDGARLVLFERSLVGSLGYANDLPRVARLIAAGRIDPERLITSTVALDETPAQLERLADDPGDDIKVLVEIGGPDV